MSVLHATAELFPWIKTGGLADVAAALPEALHRSGVESRTVVPGFPAIMTALEPQRVVYEAHGLFGTARMRVVQGSLPERRSLVYAIDAPSLYDRPGSPYAPPEGGSWGDNLIRFAMLGWVAAKLAAGELDREWKPRVLHVHDWHPALAQSYLADAWPGAKSVLTIHNIEYPGRFPPHDFNRLGLAHWHAAPLGSLEFFGDLCFLKAGALLAHRVTTVSPTYAEEITAGRYGNGIDAVLRSRGDRVIGILNGVDYETWDPAADTLLPARFDVADLTGKRTCKDALRKNFGLIDGGNSPIFVLVSRLNWQKGVDLVADVTDLIVERGGQLVVVGSGDGPLEWRLEQLRTRHPGKVGVHIGYSEPLAHLAIAGGDVLLMPSRHEPCGLTQLYAKRYGTLPLVQAVGGLADTVDDNTGFRFREPYGSLAQSLGEAFYAYADRSRWTHMQSAAMRQDYGWTASAEAYGKLYAEL